MDHNRQAKTARERKDKATGANPDGQRGPAYDTPDLGTGLRLGDEPDVVRSRSGAIILVGDESVVKLHAPGTRQDDLGRRLRLADALAMVAGPLRPDPVRLDTSDGARLATAWPRLRPLVATDPAQVPWVAISTVLAQLHSASSTSSASSAPPARSVSSDSSDGSTDSDHGRLRHGGHARLRRIATGLGDLGAPSWLIDLAAAVREELSASTAGPSIVHGDLHLGQFAQDDAGRWLLIDADDLGWGDPAYDLGRIAGLWAVGELADGFWEQFLAGYRAAGGPGVPATGDPWPRLDLPARAAVVTMTYGLLRDRASGDADADRNLLRNLLASCRRMRH